MNASAEARTLRRPFRLGVGRIYVLILLLLLELALFGVLKPAYLSVAGLLDASRAFVEAGLLSLGMTLVIITGGIDLSVASLLALVSVTIGFSFAAGLPLALSLVFGLLVGLSGGLLNGLMIAGLTLHPLLVTLGTMAFFRGFAYAVTNANAVSTFPDWFAFIGQAYLGDLVPFQLIVWLVAVVTVWILLSKTSFGRYVYGLGVNERATVFSGVNTFKVKVAVYTLSGFFAAIAAMIQTSRVFTARANAASRARANRNCDGRARRHAHHRRLRLGSWNHLRGVDSRLPAGWAGLCRGPQRLGPGGDRHRLGYHGVRQ